MLSQLFVFHKSKTQSQSFSRSYGSVLPTSLAYIVPLARGCSPWRPAAVMSTAKYENKSVPWVFKGRWERTGHLGARGALPTIQPYLRANRFQGLDKSFVFVLSRQKEKRTLPRTPTDVPKFRCVATKLSVSWFRDINLIPFR